MLDFILGDIYLKNVFVRVFRRIQKRMFFFNMSITTCPHQLCNVICKKFR